MSSKPRVRVVDDFDSSSDNDDRHMLCMISDSLMNDTRVSYRKYVFKGEFMQSRGYYYNAIVVEDTKMTLASILKSCTANPSLVSLFKAWKPIIEEQGPYFCDIAALPLYRLSHDNFALLMRELEVIPHEMGSEKNDLVESFMRMDFNAGLGDRRGWEVFLEDDPFCDYVYDGSIDSHVMSSDPPTICEVAAATFLNHIVDKDVISSMFGTVPVSDDVDQMRVELVQDACRHGMVNPELSIIGDDDLSLRFIISNCDPLNLTKAVVDNVGYDIVDPTLSQVRPMRPTVKIFTSLPNMAIPRKIRRNCFNVSVNNGIVTVGEPVYSEQTAEFVLGSVARGTPLFAMRKRELTKDGEFDVLEYWLISDVLDDYSLCESTTKIPPVELGIIRYLISSTFFPTYYCVPTGHPDIWKNIFSFFTVEGAKNLSCVSKYFRVLYDNIFFRPDLDEGVADKYIYRHSTTLGFKIFTTKSMTRLISYRNLLWMCHGTNPLHNLMQNQKALYVHENRMVGPCFVDRKMWNDMEPNGCYLLTPENVEFVTRDNIDNQGDRILVWYGKDKIELATRTKRATQKKKRQKLYQKLLDGLGKKEDLPKYFSTHRFSVVMLQSDLENYW